MEIIQLLKLFKKNINFITVNMKKYPSIEQFRHVIRTVKTQHDYKGKDEQGEPIYKHDSPYPTLTFNGTVKLHGTNAAIVLYKNGEIKFQSRENELSLTQDNAGFCLWGMNLIDLFKEYIFGGVEFNNYVAVYGEWCGGNIQKGVAINGLPKMFVIFGCKIDDKWLSLNKNCVYKKDKELYEDIIKINENNIYYIDQFQTWDVHVDFNNPEQYQNEFIKITEEVEKECPVGKYFGNSGIGEGVVWKCVEQPELMFKVKGKKHSVSKVTKLAAVDTVAVENMKQFAEDTVTVARLQQGVDKLVELGKPLDETSTGDFLRWVVGDIIKEEQDTIVKSQLDMKKLGNVLSNKARIWWFNKLNEKVYE